MSKLNREMFQTCFSEDPPIAMTEQQEERLFMLLADDENQVMLLKRQLAAAKMLFEHDLCSTEPRPGPVSKESYSRDLKTSLLCYELAERISDFGGKALRLLHLMEQYYSVKAEAANPKGKRHRKSMPQDYIAAILCGLVLIDKLTIDIAINPESDLSKLFRLCCELVGISAPSNTAYYLKPQLQEMFTDKQDEEAKLTKIEEESARILGTEPPLFLDTYSED